MRAAILLTLAVGMARLGGAAARDGARPLLICSTTQVADFARQVAGARCRVECILAPGADPHTYQPTAKDAARVAAADLCLENGLHLEGKNWMATLATDARKPIVTCTDGIAPIVSERGGEAFHDPHAWFSPRNAAVYVNNILAAVSELDPPGRAEYAARAGFYLAQLRALDSWIREQVNRISPERRILVTNHDAFNYFCREYRFNAGNDYLSLAPIGWSTGSEVGAGATPSRQKAVIASIRDTGAAAVFVETSVNPKLLREMAQAAGVRVGGRLYSDSMGESGTPGETYLGMMRENILTILAALDAKDAAAQ